ncbi:MAG: DUF2156 domain-containing protein [Acutalibacteraceae bacterium]
MLEFSEIKISDADEMNPYLQLDGAVMSDRTFASLYIWRRHYKLKKCLRDGFLYIRNESGEQNIYYMPLGKGEIYPAIEEIYRTENGRPFSISLITEDRRKEIAECLDETAEIDEIREEFDYVYLSENLIGLSGKKYQSKRNLINRFLAENEGNWEYLDIVPDRDRDQIMEFLDCWINESRESRSDYRYERSAIESALENYDALGFFGAKILVGGKIAAFTLAAKQNDETVDILIEKADNETVGAYQMINHEFAKRRCFKFKYINREEDMGIEGLRRAKMSYHPEFLTEKYAAECNRK